MKKTGVLFSVVIALGIYAFTEASSSFTVPPGWPDPVYDLSKNPLTAKGIALGKKLFFDPELSRDNTISCASCHLPRTAFTHVDHDLSHGIENRIGTRNSPALMNLAWQKEFMWDGSVHHLDVQPLVPLTSHDEMDMDLKSLMPKLQSSPLYPAMFYEAFHDSAVTGEHLLKAVSQFLLTLVSADSKYDRVMNGMQVFNEYEARGYKIFKANCASCHTEPLFTNGGFENNGLPYDSVLHDEGRMKVTQLVSDHAKFKVPALRNIEVSYPYMHDGRFRSLQMVLFHYSDGIVQSPTLSHRLRKGISLKEADKRDLIAFLKTLTDEAFLHNPDFQ